MIFYALALVLFVTGQVDAVYVGAAWVFVVFRALHSAVHCTINVIMVRFTLYLVSTLAVWFIAASGGAGSLWLTYNGSRGMRGRPRNPTSRCVVPGDSAGADGPRDPQLRFPLSSRRRAGSRKRGRQ